MDFGSGSAIWYILFIAFIFLYPRLMLSQMIAKLEKSARQFESYADQASSLIYKHSKKEKGTKKEIEKVFNLHVSSPTDLDPYGIVNRLDKIIRQMEGKFEYFAKNISAKNEKEDLQKVNYGLRAGMSVNMIAKIIRHNVELVKKFKNLQIAMMVQMQLPMIEKIIKSELEGTKAFLNSYPVGDSIGPHIASTMMTKPKEIAEDVLMSEEKINGRKCFVMKAAGPGPRLGKIQEAVKKVAKKHKIKKLITIDAHAKLEGEKSGYVNQGVGVAIGGTGVEKQLIEEALLPKDVETEMIAINVGMEEAIGTMTKDVLKSEEEVRQIVYDSVGRLKKNEKAIIFGVGNSSGTYNSKKESEKTRKTVEKLAKNKKKQKKKTGKPFFKKFK